MSNELIENSETKLVWPKFRETIALSRLAATYALSHLIHFPAGERFQINPDTFVRCLNCPEQAIGNILIIQGGTKHLGSNTYYLRTASTFIPRNVRLFIFEKLQPVVNYKFRDDLSQCLTYLKENFSGPFCVIGYSMGGILLLSYLSDGYDQADLYIPCSCPLDLNRFEALTECNFVFRYLRRKAFRDNQVDNYEQLLNCSGLSLEDHQKFLETFLDNLNKHKSWIKKTIYILSQHDPLTQSEDLNLLEDKPLTYLVQNGWHCCLDSIFLSVLLACNYLRARDKGQEPSVEEIPTQ